MSGDARRLLVEKWREWAKRQHQRANELDHARDSQSYHLGGEHAAEMCADELEAALSSEAEAPPRPATNGSADKATDVAG